MQALGSLTLSGNGINGSLPEQCAPSSLLLAVSVPLPCTFGHSIFCFPCPFVSRLSQREGMQA